MIPYFIFGILIIAVLAMFVLTLAIQRAKEGQEDESGFQHVMAVKVIRPVNSWSEFDKLPAWSPGDGI